MMLYDLFTSIGNKIKQSDLIADLPSACQTLIEILRADTNHYEALQKAIS